MTVAPWNTSVAEITAELSVNPQVGLSSSEVAVRSTKHGPNTLRKIEQRGIGGILVNQFKGILIALLAAALVASLLFGEWVEALAIGIVLLINALLGFFIELKATRSMEALRKLGATHATVIREGVTSLIPAEMLVPGDIVVVEAGDSITADLRILSSSKLQSNESTLTGESLPSDKSCDAAEENASIGERSSMLFKGTFVTKGTGTAIVVAIGMETELGMISQLLEQADEAATPLEEKLDRMGHGLVWATLVFSAIIGLVSYTAGHSLYLVIETMISLAVAAVPEGLPIIATIALARGMNRMAKRNVLINRLSAVETLGATSVICTDKTGTLTINEMQVGEIAVADGPDTRKRALEIATLCNNAALSATGQGHVGDPMEVALLQAAEKENIFHCSLLEVQPEVREVAFDSDRKMMATVHRLCTSPKPLYRVAAKGAPESILAVCNLSEQDREQWATKSNAMAERGYRVLALAEKNIPSSEEDVYENLNFTAFLGLLDPARKEVKETIQKCHQAGVRVVMVTGDHPITARNIARETGLIGPNDEQEVVLGSALEELDAISDSQRQQFLQASIFARVSPKQKLNLVTLHQADGAIIAMTGDGVNDAPALKKADIGIAMGRGTAVAQEAAAMVIQNDDLSTLVDAIAEGRTIFDNIRKFAVYLLSCNLGELLLVLFAVSLQMPLPLLPLQILVLNLVTDVFPALALGIGDASSDVMSRKPRDAKEAVVTRRHWRTIILYGVLMAGCVFAAFALALYRFDLPQKEAVTVSFLTLALCQLWHVVNMRSTHTSVFANEVTGNPWIWGAWGVSIAILAVLVWVQPLAELLSIAVPNQTMWTLILVTSAIPLLVGQLTMFWIQKMKGTKT